MHTKLPPGHSSPCIVGYKIFLTAVDKPNLSLTTICIDRNTGTVLWQRAVQVEKLETTHKTSNPAAATAACDNKAVYVYFGSFGLLGYDFDGKELWKKRLPVPDLNLGAGNNGNGSSPIVAEDMVIVDLHLKEKSHVLAVRCKDGETVWKASEPDFNYGFATPATWKEGSEPVVGILNSGKFTTFNLKDGSERWWITGLPVQTVATPVPGDNMLFINAVGFLGAAENVTQPPSFDEMLTKYDTNKDKLISLAELPGSLLFSDRKNSGGSGSMSVNLFLKYFEGKDKNTKMDRAEWDEALKNLQQFTASSKMKTAVCAVRLGGKGDVTTKNILWSESKGVPEVPSSLFYHKRLYLVKSGGLATCREPATGKLLFEERLGVVGGFFASPVASGGKIYAASDAGKVVVFEAKDTLNVLARNDLGEPIMATPAIVDGKIYVRTTGHLYAFGN